MTPEQFTYWMQGYVEIAATNPSPEQWKVIKDHLATVFNKITPPYTTYEGPVFKPGYRNLSDHGENNLLC